MKMNKNTRVSVVTGFEREKFEKWCLEQNKNPKNDISIVEYLAKVMNDKSAKLFMEKFEKGEVTADNLEMHFFNEDEEVEEDDCYSAEELEEKFDACCRLVKAIADLAGVKIDKVDNFIADMKKIDSGSKYAYVEGTIAMFGDEFSKLIDVYRSWLQMSKLFDGVLRGDK